MGSICVALLLATGLINSAFLVGFDHVGEMPRSPYGQALIAKLVLFAAMIGLAALNRFVLTPRLARGEGSFGALRWSIGLESLAAVMVLGLVAWLGTLAPLNMS
jgi:putative copper resistance protein D